jgi:hypothetical protein
MSNDDRSAWLRDRWTEKEERLSQFNKAKKFPEQVKDTPPVANTMLFIFLFWSISFAVTVYYMYTSSPFRWFILLGMCSEALVSYSGGIDNLERYFHSPVPK